MTRLGLAALAVLVLASAGAGEETTDAWVRWSRERALDLESKGQFEDAVEEWLALAQLRPDDVLPLSRAAVIAVETPVLRGRNLEAGSPEFASAQQYVRAGIARGGQSDPGLAYAVGRLHFAEGKWAKAWSTLSDAKQWGFDPVRVRYWHYRAAVNRAVALIDNGRAQSAVDELEFLRKAQPGHPEERYLLVNLAAANLRVQQPDVAITILKELIARLPGAADAHYLLGLVYAEGGRLEEAEKAYRDALVHATASYSDQTYRDALLRLCDIEIKLGKLDEAEQTASRFQAIAKDDADGLYAAGRVKQARGDAEGAALLFRRVARLRPEWMENLVNLQVVLSHLGDETKAEGEEIARRIEALRQKHAAEDARRGLDIEPSDGDSGR